MDNSRYGTVWARVLVSLVANSHHKYAYGVKSGDQFNGQKLFSVLCIRDLPCLLKRVRHDQHV